MRPCLAVRMGAAAIVAYSVGALAGSAVAAWVLAVLAAAATLAWSRLGSRAAGGACGGVCASSHGDDMATRSEAGAEVSRASEG